jgi:hypothetical protein
MLNGAYHYIDLTLKGRDEAGLTFTQEWVRRHDEYGRWSLRTSRMGTEATQIPDPRWRRTTSRLVRPGTGMTANSFDMSQGGDAGKVLFGLVCVVTIAWIYLLAGAGGEMEQMDMGGGK